MKSLHLFCFLLFLSIAPGSSGATESGGEPAPYPAAYLPTSGWLVGPASLRTTPGIPFPCVMMNQYDNGDSLRFAGTDQKLLTLAVTLRRPVFIPAHRYGVGLAIAPSFDIKTEGYAYDPTTLIINLHAGPALRPLIKDTESLLVMLDQSTPLRFSLIGTADGLTRMDRCYREQKNTQNKQNPS